MVESVHHIEAGLVDAQSADNLRVSGLGPAAAYTGSIVLVGRSYGCYLLRTLPKKRSENDTLRTHETWYKHDINLRPPPPAYG
jgi:hypothetical protein